MNVNVIPLSSSGVRACGQKVTFVNAFRHIMGPAVLAHSGWTAEQTNAAMFAWEDFEKAVGMTNPSIDPNAERDTILDIWLGSIGKDIGLRTRKEGLGFNPFFNEVTAAAIKASQIQSAHGWTQGQK